MPKYSNSATQVLFCDLLISILVIISYLIFLDGEASPIDTVTTLIQAMKLNPAEKVIKKVLVVADPAVTANTYGSVIGCYHEGQLHVAIYGGYSFPVANVPELLMTLVQLFYILNINYPSSAVSFFNFMAYLHNAPTQKSLPKAQKDLIKSIAVPINIP